MTLPSGTTVQHSTQLPALPSLLKKSLNVDVIICLVNGSGDYEELRVGDRAVSLGEQPFYNPVSKSRRVDLGLSK